MRRYLSTTFNGLFDEQTDKKAVITRTKIELLILVIEINYSSIHQMLLVPNYDFLRSRSERVQTE